MEKTYRVRLARLAQEAYEAAWLLTGERRAAFVARQAVYRRYRFISGGANARGQKVWFCWSTRKDENGLWWTWREVHTAKTILRYDVSTRKTKKAARALAYRRQNAFVDKLSGEQP